MNFNQPAGFYDAKTDELIMTFKKAYEESFFIFIEDKSLNYNLKTIMGCDFAINKPFYFILPDNVECISMDALNNSHVCGFHGKNLQYIHGKYRSIGYTHSNFFLEKNYLTKDGLLIIDDCLISASKYKKEKLIIPNNIKAIASKAFEDSYIKEIVLPKKLSTVILSFTASTKKVVIPMDFKLLDFGFFPGMTTFYYKGSEKQFNSLKKNITNNIIRDNIVIESYTIEELKDENYSLKEIEKMIDRKLTLDEILNMGKSIKDANNYFKQKEEIR